MPILSSARSPWACSAWLCLMVKASVLTEKTLMSLSTKSLAQVEAVVLHEELLDVVEAVGELRSCRDVKAVEPFCPRGLATPWPDHLRVLQAPIQLTRLQRPLYLLVLLDEGDGAPVLLLEEERLLVVVEEFALLVLLDLLLQHAKVGVHDGLLENGVLSWVFADVESP